MPEAAARTGRIKQANGRSLNETDPRRSLRLYARNVARVQERYADLHEVLQMAAAADDELAELWQTSEDERRTGAGYVIDALLGKGPLKPGLDRDSAVDLLWVFNASGIFPPRPPQRMDQPALL